MGSCPLENCFNTVFQNPSNSGKQRSSTALMLTTNMRKNSTRSTAAHPTYCHATPPVAFHHYNPNFSPIASSIGRGVGTSPPSGNGTALVDPELTNDAISAPKSSTPMALECGNRISNLVPPRGWRSKNSPPTLIVTSCRRVVLAQTTTI